MTTIDNIPEKKTIVVGAEDRHPRWPHLDLSVAELEACNAEFGPLDLQGLDYQNRIKQLETAIADIRRHLLAADAARRCFDQADLLEQNIDAADFIAREALGEVS